MPPRLTPATVRTVQEVCKLERDNLDFPTWWAMLDLPFIIVCQQKAGEGATGEVMMPRKEFERLIRWYKSGVTTKKKPKH